MTSHPADIPSDDGLEPDPSHGIGRVVIATDGSSESLAALDQAAKLAQLLGVELCSLFVQDRDLLSLAEHAQAHVVSALSGQRQTVNSGAVRRIMRSQNSRVVRATDAANARHGIATRVIVRRGRVAPEIIAAVGDGDLLAVSWASHPLSRRAQPGSSARQLALQATGTVFLMQRQRNGTISVPFDGSPSATRAVKLAALLTPQGQDLLVLLATDDLRARGKLQQAAMAALGDHASTARFTWLNHADGPALCRAAHQDNTAVLVVPRSLAQDDAMCTALFENAGCSLVLVR